MFLWFYLYYFLSHNVTYTAHISTITVSASKEDDVELLARLIYSEAGNQPYLGKVAVANVVMNRQELHGKSLRQIIYARGQFDGIRTKHFRHTPNKESYDAAYDVLVNKKRILPLSVVYFANERISTDKSWIRRVRNNKYKDIYDHTFYHEPLYMFKDS